MGDVIRQGLPAGIQNSVISIGNLVVQTNINSFGEYAMSGEMCIRDSWQAILNPSLKTIRVCL